jgi:hypothetical protein
LPDENHVLIAGVPEEKASLVKPVWRPHLRYSQYVEHFHGRFHSRALDEERYGSAIH